MALKDHKKGITRAFFTALVLFLLCFGVFSCSTYLQQQSGSYIDMSDVTLIQLDEPEDDAPAMCVHTTLGDIVAELYPDQAPQYVAQFTQLAESGYYDNTYVFQVESGVYFEAGTPNEDGTTDEDMYETVEAEISGDLWPFRGAFCAPVVSQEGGFWDRLTNNMTAYCGTRFVVCNTIEFDDATKEELSSVSDSAQEINDAFLELGGIPNYSQQMTVFAQAYGEESLQTIDAITAAAVQEAETEGGYTRPQEEIRILSIDVGTYADFAAGS